MTILVSLERIKSTGPHWHTSGMKAGVASVHRSYLMTITDGKGDIASRSFQLYLAQMPWFCVKLSESESV